MQVPERYLSDPYTRLGNPTRERIEYLLQAGSRRSDSICMAAGVPRADLVPTAKLKDVVSDLLARDLDAVKNYGASAGTGELRDVIARLESVQTGTSVVGRQVLISSGGQQALHLIAISLLNRGDPVALGEPGFQGASNVFSLIGAEMTPIEVDDEGIRVDKLEWKLMHGFRPRLVYTVPNFHNPVGCSLSIQRSYDLARLADKYHFWIVEDDPYCLLDFDGDPPSNSTLGRAARVIRVGSISKTLFPGLRVGWIVASEPFIVGAERVKDAMDMHSPALTQKVALALLQDASWFSEHLSNAREAYAENEKALVKEIRKSFRDEVKIHEVKGGIFSWIEFDRGINTVDLLASAVDEGLTFMPGAVFAQSQTKAMSSLRISFASQTAESIIDGSQRLVKAFNNISIREV